MEQSKNVQQPQHDADHYDRIQYGLDRSLHWHIAVDQPKQNAHNDQNQQYLKNRHLAISLSSQADTPASREALHQSLC